MFASAEAGPIFCTPRSACGEGVEVTPESFSLSGSMDSDADAVAMFVNVVPGGAFGSTVATIVKFALAPDASDAIVQTIVPFVPALGFVHENTGPLFCVLETNVIEYVV